MLKKKNPKEVVFGPQRGGNEPGQCQGAKERCARPESQLALSLADAAREPQKERDHRNGEKKSDRAFGQNGRRRRAPCRQGPHRLPGRCRFLGGEKKAKEGGGDEERKNHVCDG